MDTALSRALVVFSERGYHAASLAELRAAMKLATGSLYKAFEDKRAIFVATLDYYIARRDRQLRERLDAEQSGRDKLRALLQSRGYVFVTETDTEVIAHLVHWELEQGGTLREAVLRAIPQLRGAYGTVIMDTRDPGTLLASRSGSPLVIGLGMGENFIA
ncbi:MAG: TetR family transcriptional regulator, partial [Bradyrhizobium sp.]|nr:TetR family transcriptional regulator [Bradyrhizobium sp.]